jgi:hypothetical protein
MQSSAGMDGSLSIIVAIASSALSVALLAVALFWF